MATDVPRRVIVKFRDTVVLPYEDGAEAHVVARGVGPWPALAQRFPGIRLERLFTSVTPERLGLLVTRATARQPRYHPPNLLTYFVVRSPGASDAEALAGALRDWENVETAYVEVDDSSPSTTSNPKSSAQIYLRPPAVAPPPAPQGAIDALYAWTLPGGTGAGQWLVDLERGATLDHEDLVARHIPQLHGVIDPNARSHGTRVLGAVVAVDNLVGIIGIAHGAADVAYTCQVLPDGSVDRVNAVMRAVDHFTQGGADPTGRVLLLEVQLNPFTVGGVTWSFMPMEALPADFAVIQLASNLGIVVIEPTGNGHNDLDKFQDGSGKFVLSRTHPGDFKDSGAIMVGGSTADYPYTPAVVGTQGTGFGSRVDCFAWAEDVFTSDSDSSGTTTAYTPNFGGTSSASAIVAGAALLVQGAAEASLHRRLTPPEMRTVLSAPTFNTPSANPGVDLIGVMPNLRRILQDGLGIAADVYIRDYVGDTGDVHAGAISMSPDVIVRPAPEANPAIAFGPGTETDMMLGPTVTSGQDNYVYVRVWNRGAVTASNVTATVYFAPPATLLTSWTLIGSVVIPAVPPGNVMTVSPPITWPHAAVPAPGHYCFVATVDAADDAAPDLRTFAVFDDYYAYIRTNNNVTWRNFDVVDALSSGDPDSGDDENFGFDFAAPGAWDADRAFQLAVSASLPDSGRASLEVPRLLMPVPGPGMELDASREHVRVEVSPHGRTLLPAAVFPAKSRARCRLVVRVPVKRARAYDVAVAQLYDGFEVGRITWRIPPRPRPR